MTAPSRQICVAHRLLGNGTPEQISILFRPDNAAHRRQFGHWEGDLMLSKQKLGEANVTSLVERVSRFTMILKTPENAPNQ